jgi:hypothetical protein
MQLIDRKTAIANGLNKYFTGEPCLNGHVAMRYAQSGACYECIRANVERSRAAYKTESVDPLRAAREAFARDAKFVKVRVPLHSLASIRTIVAALTFGRFAALAQDARVKLDPEPRIGKALAGTAIVSLLCHAEDEPTVRAICDAECARFSAASLSAGGLP